MPGAETHIRSAPLVTWAPPQTGNDPARRARTAGAAAGCIVALAFALTTAPDGPSGPSLVAVPALAAGTIGGWLFGPTVWRARVDTDWLTAIVGLGIVGLFIGALVTGLSLGIVSASTAGGSFGEAVEAVWAMTLLAVTIGMIIPGLLILPFTLAAAAAWALLMVVIQACMSPDDH